MTLSWQNSCCFHSYPRLSPPAPPPSSLSEGCVLSGYRLPPEFLSIVNDCNQLNPSFFFPLDILSITIEVGIFAITIIIIIIFHDKLSELQSLDRKSIWIPAVKMTLLITSEKPAAVSRENNH